MKNIKNQSEYDFEKNCLWGFDYFWDKINNCYQRGWYLNDLEQNDYFDVSIKMSPNSKREGSICVSIPTGGYTGGSCWNDNPSRPYETGNSVSYDDLKKALISILNNAFDNKNYTYGTIDELIDVLIKDPVKWGIYEYNDTEYEYYGNSTDTMYIEISLFNLYKFLSKYDAFF